MTDATTGPADTVAQPQENQVPTDTSELAEAVSPENSEPTEPTDTAEEVATGPTETVPSETVPSETVPSETVPSETGPTETGPTETGPTEPAAAGDFRMALVASVTVDLPNQHPTVVLRETESPRRQLSFSIGLQDGIVLSHAMRRIATPRPLTHELMSGVLQGFDIDIVALRLVGRQGAVYFAELDLRGRTGRSVYSCRPSDGLTLAILQPVPAPILIDRRLLEQGGDVAPA